MALKQKVKDNYAKNPRAVMSLGVLGSAAVLAVIGTLTGVVEPEVAMASITKLLNFLMLGGL
ncbi:hypothetical protein Acj9p029 [Acinetobacter phage Acj9]|uniref:Uncharacterized protein n=1 Tax=Acinetobacter phage Acj9 TaxID=760939 RepID=E5EPG3_9CAUD|nr:hypothetical protein Acj9p029 [Acinetobacter phage Acj9]ADG59929.1 hypothetical protein Acj9p029 [Acinetobacter phage Acj9]